MSVREKLVGAIRDAALNDVPEDLDHDTSLLDRGIIDSTGILDLILFIEDEFGVEVADEDVVPANFESVDRIAEFVEEKRAAAVEGG